MPEATNLRNETSKKEEVKNEPSSRVEPKYSIDESGKTTCPVCGLRMLPRNLPRHMKLHLGMPHRCPGCSLFFETKEQREMHRAKKHTAQFLCTECGARYQSRGTLNEHMARDHKDGSKKVFQCSYQDCGSVYVRQSYLDDHVNKHLGLKPYICEKCAKAFTYKYALNRHGLLCKGVPVKKYNCAHCSDEYKERIDLETHICTVHPEIEFSCNCGKTYRIRNELDNHLQNCPFVKAGPGDGVSPDSETVSNLFQ